MKIKIKDYIIESDSVSGYNLFKERVSTRQNNAKDSSYEKGDTYTSLDNLGWNMSLETCIKDIVRQDICGDNRELTPHKFLEIYRSITNEIVELFKREVV